ncbi:MAG: PAS domain-containing protein, partial [Atopostipes suicloacalis]|nr:PAS domain-containing protein [Atopostipes suicloacalis]
VVKYFNNQEGPKLLPRTPNAIGRDVMNCHPPKSYRIVEQLIKDLKTGKKDQEVAWFKKGTDYVHITYVAVRDEAGEYLGILEYVQDITELVKIDGEKRVK